MALTADFQKLSITGLVTLYELDARRFGGEIYRWHGHVAFADWQLINGAVNETQDYRQDIVWQGQIYRPMAIQSDGLEVRGDGKASTPTLVLSNNIDGVQGAVSALCLRFADFAGAKLTVIQTLAKYLDSVNFKNGNPQASSEHKKQVWFVEQKTAENASQVSFELSNPVDFEGAKIPFREISNYCTWAVCGRYRGQECGYIGANRFTENGTPTDNPALDICGGRLSDCKLRFGENNPLSFGGFPSASLR